MTDKAKPEVKLDDAAILAKAASGEELSPAETEHIAGAPNLEQSPDPAPKDGEEPEGDAPEETPEADKPEGDEDPGAEATPSPTKDGEDDPDAKEEAPEDDPEEDPADAGATGKEKTPEAKNKERRELINAELEKPDHLLDLSKFTPVELGLFWDLRKERKKRQKTESENNLLRFRELKRAEEEAGDDPGEEETPTVEDIFKDRPDDDIVTVAEMKKILGGQKKPAKKEAPAPSGKPGQTLITVDQLRVQKVEANDRLKSKSINDFYDVTDFAEFALTGDTEAQEELRETAKNGGNVAERTYFLIKGSKKWPEIEKTIKAEKAKTTPPKKAAAPDPANVGRAERLVQNGKKIKTTGSSAGGGGDVGGYSRDQVAKMTEKQFAALPKKVQDAILWKFGSEPNYSV